MRQLYLQPITRTVHTTAGLDNPGIGTPVERDFLSVLMLIAVLDTGYCLHQLHEPGYGPWRPSGPGKSG
jgi:hypothetical protein